MISQRLIVSGCQATWPASGYQPEWSAYTHVLLSSCLHSWIMTALLKVNIQRDDLEGFLERDFL